MAVCHTDAYYYQRRKRDPKILSKKLPMAMIHESCGTVSDPTEHAGQKVIQFKSIPMQSDEEFYEDYMTGIFLIKWL